MPVPSRILGRTGLTVSALGLDCLEPAGDRYADMSAVQAESRPLVAS